jgi:hypothetical protein
MIASIIAPNASLSATREAVLIALQAAQVLFLAVHDWVPLGRLNDVAAVRSQDTTSRLTVVTLIQTAPFAYGLLYSVLDFGKPYPGWLMRWLAISYLILLIGQLRAWWLPYLLRPEPLRAARYRVMFSQTHSFLPERNGIVPNTAHVLLHVATLATLWFLLAR